MFVGPLPAFARKTELRRGRQRLEIRGEKLMFVGHYSVAFAGRSERNSGSMRIYVMLLPLRGGRKNFKNCIDSIVQTAA